MAVSSVRREFGTFWMGGSLSAFEQACLNTFVARGETVTLFSFEEVENLPEGVRAGNAREILSEAYTNAFQHQGKPNATHFSDCFRYAMIDKAKLIWIDTDILLLKQNDSVWEKNDLFGFEIDGSINNAVLFFSKPGLARLLQEEVEDLAFKELTWGQTGPLLLNSHLRHSELKQQALNHKFLYPIHHDDICQVFLPEYVDWCKSQVNDAVTLHMYNNVICRMGYWKSMSPPVGSFLYNCFREVDSLRYFKDVLPEPVMATIVRNFRSSQTGRDLGFKSVLKQAGPSVIRSFYHHDLHKIFMLKNFLSQTRRSVKSGKSRII